jgi:hypothetical protein
MLPFCWELDRTGERNIFALGGINVILSSLMVELTEVPAVVTLGYPNLCKGPE